MSSEPQRLRFAYEWEPADGVRAPELAATWCRLEIWVGDDCVSWVEDRASGSTRRSIYCSLYSLAEWIAFNWWFVQAHVRPAALGAKYWSFSQLRSDDVRPHAWLRHHNLRAVGDGFIWPNVTIIPEDVHIRVAWMRDEDAADTSSIRFIGAGDELTDAGETLNVLTALVESVLTRLREVGIEDSPLEQEWRANDGLSADERRFCMAAARLGVDPYAATQDIASTLLQVSVRLDDDVLIDEFLDAVDPAAVIRGLDWVETTTHLIADSGGSIDDRLSAIRDALSPTVPSTSRPWTLGYEQAAVARQALGLDPTKPAAPEELMVLLATKGTDRGLQALGGTSRSGSPALVVTTRASQPRRFAAARALWHFGGTDRRERFLLTPARTDPYRTERAFAAELLAPADGLRQILSDRTDDDLDAAAAHFDVSPLLIRHQIDNQLLAT